MVAKVERNTRNFESKGFELAEQRQYMNCTFSNFKKMDEKIILIRGRDILGMSILILRAYHPLYWGGWGGYYTLIRA